MNPYNDHQPQNTALLNDHQQHQFIPQPQYDAPQQQGGYAPMQVQHQNPYVQPVVQVQQPVVQVQQPVVQVQHIQPVPVVVQPQVYYQQPAMVEITMPGNNVPTIPRGRRPEPFFCGLCQKSQVSITEYQTGNGGLILGAGLCIFGCWICAPFVFCTEDCQDAVHTCPQCRREVGRQKFLLN